MDEKSMDEKSTYKILKILHFTQNTSQQRTLSRLQFRNVNDFNVRKNDFKFTNPSQS